MKNYTNYRAESATNKWLKTQGINPTRFVNQDVLVLQAQARANNLLGEQLQYLNTEQIKGLEQFIYAVNHPKTHVSVNRDLCCVVLNLGKKVNRKAMKARSTQ
ncbi:hypothetical protein POPA111323_09525 [Polynucleobacter paneuropaeus]|uniref:Uncharacterized protein n=1 Tax=Polynucleobacter paneuropaeus TaxID=2527775 RepID=A0A2Z4JVA3_9BURK|nr:hypothetical protein [Polynucleobacter paneuropaeus]AWW50222.1 hypothetical protein Pas1_07430 [Polynucleobacter paneuropaeus]